MGRSWCCFNGPGDISASGVLSQFNSKTDCCAMRWIFGMKLGVLNPTNSLNELT